MTPDWVCPSASEVDDLHWLSYRVSRERDSAWAEGIAATVSWVRGGRNATITERETQPVSLPVADFELFAATAVMDPGLPAPLESIAVQLGVAYLPPRMTNPQWALGSWRVLRWLTGRIDVPPIPVPERHTDGSLVTEAEYLARLHSQPAYALPEDRYRAEIEAMRLARRSRGLHELIQETRRWFTEPAGLGEQLYTYRPGQPVDGSS